MWKELQDKIDALLTLIRKEEITDGAIEGAVDRLSKALDLIKSKQFRKRIPRSSSSSSSALISA